MFPINFNFPYRKKDGSLITMEKALDGAGADLDLIDLDDVAITTPVDNDGLVYNATAQKWENKPVVTRKIVTIIDTMPATATNKPVGGCPVGYVLIGADVYNASDNRWDSMPVGVFPDRPCYITSYSDSTTTYARPYLESGGVTAYGGQTFRALFMKVN